MDIKSLCSEHHLEQNLLLFCFDRYIHWFVARIYFGLNVENAAKTSLFSLSPQATRAIGAISLVTAAASAFSVLGLINTRSRNRPF